MHQTFAAVEIVYSMATSRLPIGMHKNVYTTVYWLLAERAPEVPREIASLSRRDIATIVACLAAEGLCGYALSRTTGLDQSLPGELVAGLRRVATTEYQTWRDSESAIGTVLKIISRYTDTFAVIKGRAVAAAVYPAPHLRHSADVDVVVSAESLKAILASLQLAGFAIDQKNSARYRSGPLLSAEHVLLQPHHDFVSCDVLPLSTADGINLDLKLDPLESGLRMTELARFFDNCANTQISGIEVKTPDLIDMLLIACCHLHKDNFRGLRLLLDVHLLSQALAPVGWRELVRRARTEGMESAVRRALNLALERLHSPVPEEIIARLSPTNFLNAKISPLLSYRFLWSQNSLPMLAFHSLAASNRKRKINALCRSFFPGRQFLRDYYAAGDAGANMAALWLLHCFAIVAPDGLVRRTLGRFLWKDSSLQNV